MYPCNDMANYGYDEEYNYQDDPEYGHQSEYEKYISNDINVQYELSFHDQEVYANVRNAYIEGHAKLISERTKFITMSSNLLHQDACYNDCIENNTINCIDNNDSSMYKDYTNKKINYRDSRNSFKTFFESYNKTIENYENLKSAFRRAHLLFLKKRIRYDKVWEVNHVIIKPKRPLWPLCKFVTSNGEPFSIFKGIYHLSDLTESQENRKIQIPMCLLNNNKTEKNMFVVNDIVFPLLIYAAEDIIKIALVNPDIPVTITIFKIPDYVEPVFSNECTKKQKAIDAFNKKITLLSTNPEWKNYITDLKSYNYKPSEVYINNFLRNYKKLYDVVNCDQIGIMFIDDFNKYSYHDDDDE